MRTLSLSLLLVGTTAACGQAAAPITSCPAAAHTLSYATDVAPLTAKYCTKCHTSGASSRMGAPSDVNFDSYTASTASASRAEAELKAGTMPDDNPSSMSVADRCVFINWVDAGTAP